VFYQFPIYINDIAAFKNRLKGGRTVVEESIFERRSD
jgi:hypothetical protein